MFIVKVLKLSVIALALSPGPTLATVAGAPSWRSSSEAGETKSRHDVAATGNDRSVPPIDI